MQDGILQVRGGEEVKAVYYPQTPGAPSQPIIDTTYTNKGSTGKITITGANGLKLANFNAGDTLYFRLEDPDLNMNLFAIDEADIWVVGDAIASGRTVTLTEMSGDSSVLSGENGRVLCNYLRRKGYTSPTVHQGPVLQSTQRHALPEAQGYPREIIRNSTQGKTACQYQKRRFFSGKASLPCPSSLCC